ncbi:MAG: NAD(P)/FAD-dependent oxidoreductase [Chloroflexota bacterium]|nr:MAG: NAD(P)/FAD-dependent oxidoreductase [Chloroflexota bacterium]
MSHSFDFIIIGAGLNGLTAAAYLAKAGKKVLVLERREIIGGAAVTEEIFPGFKLDTVTHNVAGFDANIARDLNLAQYGLELIQPDVSVFAPQRDGGAITLWRDDAKTADSIRVFSPNDATKWRAFRERMAKLARVLDSIHALTPPSITTTNPAELFSLGKLGLQVRGLGKRDMPEFLRALPMPIAELLDYEFENDLLKGALAAGGIHGLMLGPLGVGTTYNFLRGVNDGVVRATTFVRGGVGKLADALASAAKARGAEIRTNAHVVQIRVRDQRATGVVLASGEEINAPQIISSADPKQTFLQLIDPIELDPTFCARIRNIRTRGVFAKMNLALDALPNFKNATEEQLRGTISISPNMMYLERAYDDAKYGNISQQPYLEITIPTLLDPSRAPQGKHVLSVWMQYVGERLETGDLRLKNEQLGDLVIRTLSDYAPNLQSLVLHSQVLSPCDLQEIYSLPNGDINHGQTTLDQFLFMRPVPHFANYRTPLEGLFFCGAGAHPGGIPCAAGRNAAREILK